MLLAVLVSAFMIAGCASQQSGGNQQSAGYETSSASGPAVAVQNVIPFDSQAGIRLEVKKQCRLQTKVPKFVEQYGPEHGVNVQRVENLDASDAARKLRLVIVDLKAPDDWTDEDAWMLVKGELYENGKKTATVLSLRATEGGAFAEFKSSCAIIGRCTKAIGDDMASWLRDPQDGARIGDWRSGYLPRSHRYHRRRPSPRPSPSPSPGPSPPGPW